MLSIRGISKTYRTGGLVQKALDGVSLTLRDNEFVAILGQSGSGKTTLLNVLGGLDRYDEGDLIINGVSTKKYKSRDWDAYRNHSVGFVFQSYNLIPHQTVLANVELALTIGGGLSKRDRTRRAKEALDKVGLSDHIHKKPSQLSGGQMQRVAIARALVNDPDILLADEPTGALDSETSVQVMDLLKEVASDRLVVMVTHNPELAELYATRIVRLRDGRIIDDTDPCDPSEMKEPEPVNKKRRRSSMSFLTALNLSLKNLWTKKVRTLLVAFAGSIGIIGIAAILSMSNGADTYIRNVQEETLKSYPLSITGTSFDIGALMAPSDSGDAQEQQSEAAEVREWRMMTSLFSRVAKNDLKSLRAAIENDEVAVYSHAQTVEYDYDVTPQIYALRGESFRQVNPDRSFAALGFSVTDTMSGMMSGLSSTNSFYPLPAEDSIYKNGYDVKAGRWPESWNECVLVLSRRGFISDLTLYTLGVKDPADLDALVKAFAEGRATEVKDDSRTYSYDEFLGIGFKLVNAADRYVYDNEYGVRADRSGDNDFMLSLVKASEDLTIVGVVQPNEDNDTPALNVGIGYSAALTLHVMEKAAASEAVKAQLADPETDVFTGMKFGETANAEDIDLSSLFSVDEETLKGLFSFDSDALGDSLAGFDITSLGLEDIDIGSLIDTSAFNGISLPGVSQETLGELLSLVTVTATEEELRKAVSDIFEGYLAYAANDPATDYGGLSDAVSGFLNSSEAREVIEKAFADIIAESGAAAFDSDSVLAMLSEIFAGFPAYVNDHPITPETDPQEYINDYLATGEAQAAIAEAGQALAGRLSQITLTAEQINGVISALYEAYQVYAENNSLPDPARFGSSFSEFLATEEGRKLVSDSLSRLVDTSALEARVNELYGDLSSSLRSQLTRAISRATAPVAAALGNIIAQKLQASAGDIAEYFAGAFSFDPEALASAFSFNMSAREMTDLMSSILSTEEGSFETNLRKLGYAEIDDPSSITIYPIDFEGKTAIKEEIDRYNDRMKSAGEDDKVIVYTDLVDTLMRSVTEIIDAISIILIAFVAVSLVVSSVMIGVITYISVLERKKEIGILRAIGASKRNVSNVFNAETFIIGALSGVMGILVTSLLLIPANSLIHNLSGQNDINAILPPLGAVLLILLSITLTLIGGIIPSRKASRSDPVTALRSE